MRQRIHPLEPPHPRIHPPGPVVREIRGPLERLACKPEGEREFLGSGRFPPVRTQASRTRSPVRMPPARSRSPVRVIPLPPVAAPDAIAPALSSRSPVPLACGLDVEDQPKLRLDLIKIVRMQDAKNGLSRKRLLVDVFDPLHDGYRVFPQGGVSAAVAFVNPPTRTTPFPGVREGDNENRRDRGCERGIALDDQHPVASITS